MLSIYLCEENEAEMEYFEEIIRKYLLCRDWDIQFVGAFTSPDELLQRVKESKSTGIYFLDVDFGLGEDNDGFVLARNIRKCDPRDL